MKFLLEIITPQRLALSQEVDMVEAPTSRGLIGVLAHHEPLFTPLSEGEIRITTDNKDAYLAIGGGFMQVEKSKVLILVSRAVGADELNEAEIKRSVDAAKEIIARKAKGEELQQAQTLLRRSILELRVMRRRKAPIH